MRLHYLNSSFVDLFKPFLIFRVARISLLYLVGISMASLE